MKKSNLIIILLTLIASVSCNKEQIVEPNTSPKNLGTSYNSSSQIDALEETTTNNWKQSYDATACTTNQGDPGVICKNGGGGTCSQPTGCVSIFGLYPNTPKEEVMKYWNSLPKETK
ncbi:MAG: hypothetical protein H6553_13600 [Chitinophagales bacterium]|nr:hypothetical protein [Chitinophagales bacterium]